MVTAADGQQEAYSAHAVGYNYEEIMMMRMAS